MSISKIFKSILTKKQRNFIEQTLLIISLGILLILLFIMLSIVLAFKPDIFFSGMIYLLVFGIFGLFFGKISDVFWNSPLDSNFSIISAFQAIDGQNKKNKLKDIKRLIGSEDEDEKADGSPPGYNTYLNHSKTSNESGLPGYGEHARDLSDSFLNEEKSPDYEEFRY